MKTTDFALYLQKYFHVYLPNESGCTPFTVDSYRYTFMLYLTFMQEKLDIPANMIQISDLTRENVLLFLEWLQEQRTNSIATRNQRQAAINSFVRFLMYAFPDHLAECQRILGIPVRKAPQKEVSYMKTDGVKLLMDQVDLNASNGLRDYVMLSLLYAAGLRVSELINICIKDLSLYDPYTLLIHGKGQKSRYVPLMKNIVPLIQKYLIKEGYDRPEKMEEWLFKNHLRTQFTRQGVNYLLGKYVKCARKINPEIIPADFSPHKMRHSTAMSLVDSGVDLIYIRDLLGHVSVKTTEVYARADVKRKREAIEAASKEIVPAEAAEWDNNTDLKQWLKTFNRR